MDERREERRRRGERLRARQGGPSTILGRAIGFDALEAELVYGALFERDALPQRDRALCRLAAAASTPATDALPPLAAGALDAGLEPRAAAEVVVQCGLYRGFLHTGHTLARLEEVFRERGIEIPEEAASDDGLEALTRAGEAFLAKLHGERGQAGYAAKDHPTTGALYALAVQYGYGALWQRPGLSHRERMLCALVSFATLGLDGQLEKFAASAPSLGLSREEIIEALMQTAPVTGFPRALNALARLG